ncbi:MAG: ABC transporter permease, partial [Bacteroidetes bacterium]|nr:ABC transporter permease [Bacteroidota bacterium]
MAAYSNFRAGRALVIASLQAILRSPSSVVFGLAFPLIFILVFGFLGGSDGGFSSTLALAKGSDTLNPIYAGLKRMNGITWKQFPDSAAQNEALHKDKLVAILSIKKQPGQSGYDVRIRAASTDMPNAFQLQGVIQNIIIGGDPAIRQQIQAFANIQVEETQVREYKRIDFILPGQLGFSLLAGSVFGTAFVFFGLRQTLVLKRFFATPVRRATIVVSEGIARMIFQLLTAIVIIGIGYYAFGFTLVNGFATFMALMALSALSIMVFMGFGFVVSNVAKNESVIPAFSNIITLPQFLLAGVFFPITVFPAWLQPLAGALPLAFLNDALR